MGHKYTPPMFGVKLVTDDSDIEKKIREGKANWKALNKERLDNIRKINGQNFINDLRKYPVLMKTIEGAYIPQQKTIIWEKAQKYLLTYTLGTFPLSGKKFMLIK